MKYPFESLPLYPTDIPTDPHDLIVYAIIEQEGGSTERIHWDQTKHEFVKTGLKLSIPLPAPYGWLPQTLSLSDNAALDVLILTNAPLQQGQYLEVRPIGVLLRRDQDHKILAVDITDDEFGRIRDCIQLSSNLLTTIEDWFRPYFILDGWSNAEGARQMIKQGLIAYLEQHP